jgi:hypothetical protein
MEEKKKIAALLKKPEETKQTAEQVVSENNLSSNAIKPVAETEVDIGELATRVSGVESLVPKLQIKIGKVSKKVDSLKSVTNKKIEKITQEIDIIAEGLDGNNTKVTKLTALINKQKKDGDKQSKNLVQGNNKIISILTNMLDFMKLTYEEDKLAREQQNNFGEERSAEQDRKDKALLEALKGKKKPTAEKIKEEENKDEGFLGKLLDTFGAILGPLKAFMSAIGTLFSVLSKFVGMMGKFLLSAGKFLLMIGRFFLFNPLGIALLAGVAATAALLTLLATDKNPGETSKAIINAGAADGGMAQSIIDVTEATDENAISAKKNNLLADRPSEKKSLLPWKDPDLQKAYLQEIGWDEKTGTTKVERDAGAIKIDANGKLVYKVEAPKAVAPSTSSSTEEGMKNYKSRAPAATTTEPAAVPQTETPKVTPQPEESKNVPTISQETQDTATPMAPTQNLGTKVADMSTENALTKTVVEMGEASSNQVNNVMAATKRIVEHVIERVPSVRNQEETFQRMILNSTRVV